MSVKIEKVFDGYTIYVNGNYIGTYNRTITNLKLRCWHLPEVEV